ncbi:MAG: helix-turn-helix domain-containing protein [Alphaproteobacteria bacterium]|nr:helix-turn-helix domain-containing protein [Alphaproteobacteria bacterium]
MTSSPDPIDIHVGSRVRLRRTLLGLSQVKLAQMLGLTFQQVQKYEKGNNRIGSSRLFHISKILDVPVAYFFDEIIAPTLAGGVAEPSQAPYEVDTMARRETLELVRAYYRIADPDVRRRVYELVKSMSQSPSGSNPQIA